MRHDGPDFEELVGTDLEPEERKRLLRVHELLVAAGPPPDYAQDAPPIPREAQVVRFPLRGRRIALVAVAAAFAIALFGAGFFVGDRNGGPQQVVTMVGTAQAATASASLELFPVDDAGNWPMKLEVRGLTPTLSGRPYELWLARGNRLAALCGSFRADPDGTTRVPLTAPYRLTDFDAWVIVEEGTKTPLLTTT
jgi:hypothetical protein